MGPNGNRQRGTGSSPVRQLDFVQGRTAAKSASPLDVPLSGALRPMDTGAIDGGSLLDREATPVVEDIPAEPKEGMSRRRLLGVGLLAFGIVAATLLGLRVEAEKSKPQNNLNSLSSRIQQQQLPVSKINKQLSPATTASNAVTVNGQLQVTNSLVLQPSAQTSPSVTGQMYYDAATNSLEYYNGSKYVSLQGGGNTYVTNVAGNTTNVTNVTNITNVTNPSSGGFTGTGTPGTLAMFATASTLGNSLITESGTTLNVGTTATTTDVQGGTGGLNIATTTESGATGAVTIESGGSSTTNSGDVTIDSGSGVVNGTVIDDFTFETGIDGFDGAPYGTAISQSNVMAHSGSYSLAVPLSNLAWASATSAVVTVTPGHEYKWSAWLQGATATATVAAEAYYINGGNTSPPVQTFTDSVGSWTQVSGSFVVPTGTTELTLTFVYEKNAASEVHYIDDVTFTDLNSFTGLAVNIGTTNAQAVSIGNSNQVGDTTITGSTTGVKINDATGNVDLASGADILADGKEIDLDATDGLTADGGLGNVSIVTDTNGAASGNITIESGESTTTSSGNVTVDTGESTINGLVVADYGFEDGIDGGFAPYIGTVTDTQDCTVAHSGSCSLNVTGSDPTGGGNYVDVQMPSTPGFPVTPGHRYEFSIWVLAKTTAAEVTAGMWGFTNCYYGSVVDDNTTSWTNLEWSCIDPAGVTTAGFVLGFDSGATETHYFDDVTVTDVSSSSATAELNLGNTNAQSVTIGNTNETGLTSVYGASGIMLNSGTANIEANGGEINLSAQASSSFTTSGGALTLLSAATTDWGVSAVGSGTGGSLTLNAGAASDGVSNGGNLELQGGAATGTGVSGNVGIGTGSDSGTTGTITIESGNSSTVASGDVTVDTGQGFISGTITSDFTFEDDTVENLDSWFCDTIAPTNTIAHTGSYSLMVTESAGCGNWGVILNGNEETLPVTAGHHILVSLWARAAATPRSIGGQFVFNGGGGAVTIPAQTDTTTGWTDVTLSTVVPAGSTSAIIDFGALGVPGEVQYFDDITVTDESSSPSTSSLNLGNTNAEMVNIGNLNELGATSIEGGSGITLDSNSGPITATGGSINFSGTATSSYGTSNGSLTLNAGGGVGGGVIVKPQSASTTAFQVQGPTADLLTVDSVDSRIDIGSNGTPTGQLYVAGLVPTTALSTTSLAGTAEGLYVKGKYAYVLDSNNGKLQIYDVSNPASPESVGQLSLASNTHPWFITVQGIYAYITDYGTNQMQIINVSSPVNPTVVGTVSTSSGPRSIAIEGHYAYVVSDNGGSGGGSMQVYDVSNPANPAQVGSSFVTSISSPKSDYVQGRYLYIANASSATIQVVDIANPASPSSVSVLNGGMSAPHSLTVAGRYAYVVDWSGNALDIFDESTPGSPSLAGSVSTGSGSNPQDVYVQGRYAYVVDGSTNNMQVIDISNPASPQLIGTVATGTDPIDVTVVGRYAYVLGESSDELQIFDVGGAYVQQLEAGGIETGTLEVDNNASIQNNLDIGGGLEVADGADLQGDVSVIGSITINGHVVTEGNTPSIAAGAGACASPTLSVAGDDTAGTVTVTTGTGCSGGGALATITFSSPYTNPPNVTLTPSNASASTLQYFNGASTTTTFTVDTNNTPSATTTYAWHYWVAQ